MRRIDKKTWMIMASLVLVVFMLILASGASITGAAFGTAVTVIGCLALGYWLGFAVRVIGFFGQYNENAWPRWVGLWTTMNLLWVAGCYEWLPSVAAGLSIFLGPVIGSIMPIASVPIDLLHGLRSELTQNELPYYGLIIVYWATIAGLVRALRAEKIRQAVACVILVIVCLGTSTLFSYLQAL